MIQTPVALQFLFPSASGLKEGEYTVANTRNVFDHLLPDQPQLLIIGTDGDSGVRNVVEVTEALKKKKPHLVVVVYSVWEFTRPLFDIIINKGDLGASDALKKAIANFCDGSLRAKLPNVD